MESNKKLPLLIVAAILFFLVYIIFAAKPLRKEYQFQPVWKINITKQVSELKENEQQFYFRLGNNLGYFTDAGNITLYKTFPSLASISDTYFCIYDNNARNTTFYKSSGLAQGVINFEGFPYIIEDMIYVMLPGGNSFVKCDSDGNQIWKYEGILPITAFKATSRHTAVGFADGSIDIFNNESGVAEIQFAPGGSDLPVVLGIDISQNGEYIAAVCGHNKQRFVLAHREENQPKIIFHTFLNSNSANQCLVHFCNDESRVIYNYENTIGIYNYKKNQNDLISIDSKIISIRETDNLVFLLGKTGKKYSVYILEKTNTLEGSFSFTAETAFIQTGYDNLYVGKDDSISKISLERK